ncbi:hypothetical protein FB567DRAFT_275708 [Paraphoma chrysanthemicola]|uniref:F-box domain-containing protein n=1 Tax=Paraphoma chrysanthemicola TaxID=798071 RepID=A0A8K0RCG1_9PLEO|nr:hypothetical protein FB567DRAFT_275708 [Paraphoma chrysanthemicola]
MSSAPLLRVPNEILLDILDYLEQQDRQAALCQLSLVNHQLACFAKDALFMSPSINPRHGRLLAKQLIRYPQLANKIVNLEVLHTWTHHKAPAKCEYGTEFEESGHARQVRPSTLRCLHALRSHGITEKSFIWVPWLDANDCFAYIALVIVISKRLRRLKLSEQFLRALCQAKPADQDKRPFRPYLKSLALWERSLYGLDRLSLSSTGLPAFCNTQPNYSIRYLDFSVFDGVGCIELPALVLAEMMCSEHLAIVAGRSAGHELPSFPVTMRSLRITGCNMGSSKLVAMLIRGARVKYTLLEEIVGIWDGEEVPVPTEPGTHRAGSHWQSLYETARQEGIILRWTT